MTNKELILGVMRDQGRADALDLRERAKDMDGTAIIAEEQKVPLFVWGTDYSGCPVGSPIGEIIDGELQIFTMITPVNTANYPGITPNTERSLYSLCHTKDPAKAKPWVAPYGTSGLWHVDEVCTHPYTDGTTHVFRNRYENNDFPPLTLNVEDRWEDLGDVSK